MMSIYIYIYIYIYRNSMFCLFFKIVWHVSFGMVLRWLLIFSLYQWIIDFISEEKKNGIFQIIIIKILEFKMKKGLNMEIRSGPWLGMEKWKTHPYSRKVEVLSAATPLPALQPQKEKEKDLLCRNFQYPWRLIFTTSLPKFSRPI